MVGNKKKQEEKKEIQLNGEPIKVGKDSIPSEKSDASREETIKQIKKAVSKKIFAPKEPEESTNKSSE